MGGFFGAFAPETTNITNAQNIAYERSLDRQKQLEQAMRDALENRRLEAMIQQENARTALDQRRVALDEQAMARGGVAQPRGNPVYNWSTKQWEQEMWNPLSGQISSAPVPNYAGDPTGVEEMKAKFKAVTGQDWTPETQLTPELKDQLEIFGWKFPNTRPTDQQKFAEYQTMLREMHPDWSDDQVNQEAMIMTNRYAAAQAGVYTSRPRAAGTGAEGLSAADQRALKDEIMDLDQAISEAYKDARQWAKSASTKQSLQDQTWMQDYQKAQAAQDEVKRLRAEREKIINGYLERARKQQPTATPQGQPAGTPQPGGGTPTAGAGGGLPAIPPIIRSPLLQGPSDTGEITQADLNNWLGKAALGQSVPPEILALLKQKGMDLHVGGATPPASPAPVAPTAGGGAGLPYPEGDYGPAAWETSTAGGTTGGLGYPAGDMPPAAWERPPAARARSTPPAGAAAGGARPGVGKKFSVSQWQLNNRDPNIKPWQAAREAALQGYQVVP